MVADRLDALCAEIKGCTALAYADLSINMVLVTNSGANLSREILDELCSEAEMTLGSNHAVRIGQAPVDMAYTATPDHSKVFVRDAAEPNDVLLGICDADIDMDAFLAAAQVCLKDLAGEAA